MKIIKRVVWTVWFTCNLVFAPYVWADENDTTLKVNCSSSEHKTRGVWVKGIQLNCADDQFVNSAFAQLAINGRWMTQKYTAIHWGIGGLFAISAERLDKKEEIPKPIMSLKNDGERAGDIVDDIIDDSAGGSVGSDIDPEMTTMPEPETPKESDSATVNDAKGALSIKWRLMHKLSSYTESVTGSAAGSTKASIIAH